MTDQDRLRPRLGPAGLLILGSIVLGAVTVAVGTQDNPSKLAVSLLQGITLVFGTLGSYILGRDASREAAAVSREAATESLRLPARSAFRRVKNLYGALGRQQVAINRELVRLAELAEDNGETVQFEHAKASLSALEIMVIEQISTVDDALDDWRDLVPDEVAAIEAAGREREELDD
jgi:hypothetical protein